MAKYKIIPSSRNIVQSPISIGHKAEKGVEAIEFDLTAWVETYGSGTLTVIMRRWGDAIPYPIALEIDEDNKATWVLSDTDTARAGMAYAQLSYIVGETVVKKSDIYTFRVMDSLNGEGEPPEAYESWLEHLTHLAAEAMAEVLDIEGIVTDKTLTVDGGIADAKATGEALAGKVDAADYSELSARVGANTIALAEKADRSTTYTKAQVDQMIEDVEVETDTTLEIDGAPADAAETGRQIGLIKADLATLADITPIPDNSDLNNYGETGLYSIEYGNYTILNYPPVPTVASYLEVRKMTTGYVGQKLTIPGTGKVFTRRRFNNGQWNNWIRIASDKIDIQQSPSDSGKALVIGSDGCVRPGAVAGGDGLTDDIKEAILNAFNNVAWQGEGGDQCYNALYNALYDVRYPRITAVLNLGERTVYTKDALETIKWYLTVTYYETEESEGTVISASNYSLVGTLSEGTNRLTVTYGNLSTTITVPAKTPKYNYKLSLGELTKHNAYPDGSGAQPMPWLAAANHRRTVSCSEGYSRFGNGNGGYTDGAYMIPVPGDATNVSVSIAPTSMYVTIQMWEIYNSNKIRRFVSPEKGWTAGANSGTWANPDNNLRMVCFNIKQNSSGSTFTTEPTEFNITFS